VPDVTTPTMVTAPPGTPASVLPALPDRIVVGLDGTGFGDRALSVASELANAIGAELTLLSVVEYAVDFEERAAYLADLHHQYNGHLALLFETDARQALARRQPGELLCLATRGRSTIIRSLLGSVAFSEVAAGRPAILVGYSCAVRTPGGPVVLPVGGGVDYHESVAIAAAWAAKLGVDVVVVTAAPGAPHHSELAADHAVDAITALGVPATATVLDAGDDPIRSLVRWSHSQPSSLVVAPSTIESGQPRELLHSHIADLVSRVRAPVLVVPSRVLYRP